MTTAIATLSQDEMSLVKSTIARGATDDELKLFLYRCKHMGLDPLKPGHIHFIKYGSGPGTIVIGIDGFRSRASSTGKHTGTKRGVIRDSSGACIGAWCEVYRSDWQHPAREEVSLAEYHTNKGNWSKMPETMIKKVAEVAALRMAFPDELGGVYSDDEMDQAHNNPRVEQSNPIREAKAEIAAVKADPSQYVVPFGKFRNQKLSEITIHELESYVEYIQKKAIEEARPLQGKVLEFIEAAGAFVESRTPKGEPVDTHEDIPF